MGEPESTSNVRGHRPHHCHRPEAAASWEHPMAITGVKWSLQPWMNKPQTAIYS